jgi:PAS domain S-box-containing protein
MPVDKNHVKRNGQLLRRLPLMGKLLLLAVLPILFAAYLTFELYREKTDNVTQIKAHLQRIEQTATITRLIDQLQMERRFSFDFALTGAKKQEMMAERRVTDSLLRRLQAQHDKTLEGFMDYAFLDNIDTVRNKTDRKAYSHNQVMHFYSSAVFRYGTLNQSPLFAGEFLGDVYSDMTMQNLLSEIIIYQGLITANIYNVLYTRQYMLETLLGTLPSYDIYKSYKKELLAKAEPAALAKYNELNKDTALQSVQTYMEKLFSTFKFDSTYDYLTWRKISIHSLDVLRAMQMDYLKNAESRIQHYYDREAASRNRALVLLILFSALIVIIAVYILLSINRGLQELTKGALQLARGATDIKVNVESKDAIGSLANSIEEIDHKNKELAIAAKNIGEGNFTTPIRPRSGSDVLGNAIVKMRDDLLRYTTDLENSREEFEKLADFMPQIVWTADGSGKFTYYNKKWFEITGWKQGNEKQSWIPVLHPADVGHTLSTWFKSVETGAPYEIEYRFYDVRSQEWRWFLGRAVPVRDSDQTIVKWFGTATDIHDRKIQHDQLEELVATRTLELNRSNEDLMQFAHVASHDLKEPLRKIHTFSHRLIQEYGDLLPDKGKLYLDKLKTASNRMSAMIDGILNYSVMNATEQLRQAVDLNLLMDGVRNDLELLILQKEANIHSAHLPTVTGSPTLLYQLLYNLVNNALKFSRDDRVPEIRVVASDIADDVLENFAGIKKDGKYIQLVVQDNGIGFRQEYADRMFNVFTRLNGLGKYEGTGLGLALCKKIVHRHNGIIYARGEEGVGSSFHVILPVN